MDTFLTFGVQADLYGRDTFHIKSEEVILFRGATTVQHLHGFDEKHGIWVDMKITPCAPHTRCLCECGAVIVFPHPVTIDDVKKHYNVT